MLQPSSSTERGTSLLRSLTSASRSASVTSFFVSARAIAARYSASSCSPSTSTPSSRSLPWRPRRPDSLPIESVRPAEPDGLRGHDLVGQRVLEEAVLVDAGLVRERVRPDDRLVGLDREAREVAHEARGRGDLLGLDAGREVRELPGPRPEGHDDLLEAGVAGALAEAVDRDLDLAGAGLDRGERVRRREAQVVVAVDGDDGGIADPVLDPADERPELGRDRVAHGVRDVERRGAGLGDGLVDVEQEVVLGARRVLGRELDLGVAAQRLAGPLHPAHRFGEGLLAADAQLVLEVDVARRDEQVEVRALGDADGLDGPLRVAVLAARERRDGDPALRLLRDPPDRLEVAGRRGREAGLDDVHLEPRELARDLQLLRGGQAGAGRLLAVAERRVEDPDLAGPYALAEAGRDGLERHVSGPPPVPMSPRPAPGRPRRRRA